MQGFVGCTFYQSNFLSTFGMRANHASSGSALVRTFSLKMDEYGKNHSENDRDESLSTTIEWLINSMLLVPRLMMMMIVFIL